MAIVASKKTKLKLTYEDFLSFPPDGRRHEIVEGEHLVSPPPWTYHQTLSRRIQFQLYQQIEVRKRGEVYDAPVGLMLSEFDIVQPDLVVVLAHKKDLVTRELIRGAPDLIIEILSESTAARDRGLKKDLYQRAGVPEYWIVDPQSRQVEQYILRDGACVLAGVHSERIIYQQLPDVVVDLTVAW